MEDEIALNERLVKSYKEWCKEIPEELLGEGYSNPYYVSIPDNWCKSKNRIMIVGEEGAGSWGCGKTKDEKSKIAYNTETWNANDIGKIQSYNREQIDFQCELYKIHGNKWYEKRGFKKNKNFWKRFKRIYDELRFPCIWNEIDKVHSIILRGKNYKYKLKSNERESLHKTKLKILMEEISILQPNIVVFFGWHDKSLELEDIELFKKCKKEWNKRITLIKGAINNKEINYVFTYHPNYKVVCNEQYEDELIIELKKLI